MNKSWIPKLDRFTKGLLISVGLGLLLPCSGLVGTIFNYLSDLAIILLFFLYGAKLSRRSVWEGVKHWRLQGAVIISTFVLFPLLGLCLAPLWKYAMGSELSLGMLYVCMLPSTVQSSIAFTSIAKGNVPAAICAASISSLLGVFLTPFLVGFVVDDLGGNLIGFDTFLHICYIILVPFLVGQVVQKRIGKWVSTHKNLTSWTDQTTVWLVLYTAFSHAMVQGIWGQLPWVSLLMVIGFCSLLLLIVMFIISKSVSKLGFCREDSIAIIFCGSKKSLATGIPMMKVIFAGGNIGILMIPIIVFHQIQLMVCSYLAQKWGKDETKLSS